MLDGLTPRPRGVLFDYGNTLIPFGRAEVDRIADALVRFFLEEIPIVEETRVREALDAAWVTLYRQRLETLTESDPRDVTRLTFRALGAEASEDGHVARGIETTHDAFVAAVTPGDGAARTLEALAARGLPLGLVSNYSLGSAIRSSLETLGLGPRLSSVLVSADIGLVKPHPEVFLEGARMIGLEPAEILFVGDNLRADIAGAAAVGMRTAHITQHLAGALHTEENAADVRPDLVLEHITDLLTEG
ncbi:MAG: HAD family hydrolase [Planctomycetota bacterium]|jgi:putative hydrolase of the HAD superfamily